MAQYMITYLGGNPPATAEEGKQHFARYMQWLATLGSAVVSPANPLKNTCVMHPGGEVTEGGDTGMSGFTLIEAESMQAAQDMARDCPFLDIGGSLEISELIKMPKPSH